jgi:copper(I)-binding protein
VELHTHQEDAQGVRRMRAIERIEVPATGSTVLVPGGHHLMLFNLTAPLTEGGTIALTLAFADQRTVTTTVPVRWAGATAADDAACCPH